MSQKERQRTKTNTGTDRETKAGTVTERERKRKQIVKQMAHGSWRPTDGRTGNEIITGFNSQSAENMIERKSSIIMMG